MGEGVLASFNETAAAVRVGLELAEVLASGEATRGLRARASVHRGPTMAATINDQLDYFGLTVAQTTCLLRVAEPGGIVLSAAAAADPAVMAILRARRREAEVVTADLPGRRRGDRASVWRRVGAFRPSA